MYRGLYQHPLIQKKCYLHLEIEEVFFFFCLALSCVLFEVEFQEGCVERRERDSLGVEAGINKNRTQRRKL